MITTDGFSNKENTSDPSRRYGISLRRGKQVEDWGSHVEMLMEYSIYDACRSGFNKIVFTIKRNTEESFRELIESHISDGIEIRYVCQEYDCFPGGFVLSEGRVKPYGTAHAVLAAKNVIHEPFAVINADDFYGCGVCIP